MHVYIYNATIATEKAVRKLCVERTGVNWNAGILSGLVAFEMTANVWLTRPLFKGVSSSAFLL